MPENSKVLSAPDADKIRSLAQYAQGKANEATMAQEHIRDFLALLAVRYEVPEPVAVTPEGMLVHQEGVPGATPEPTPINRAQKRRADKAKK